MSNLTNAESYTWQIIQENYEKAKDPESEELFERTKMELLLLLKQSLRPEFLNRIDEVIVFASVSDSEL